jgi:Type VI secretion system effector, Hcp
LKRFADAFGEMGRLAVVSAALAAMFVLAAPASAAQLLARNASKVSIKVDKQARAVVYYRIGGQEQAAAVWGAINALPPSRTRKQVEFKVDYSGGFKVLGTPLAKNIRNVCGSYRGPQLPWFVSGCSAPDGSHWALQSFQRLLPNLGLAPWLPSQRAYELWISHWKGDLPQLESYVGWFGSRKFHQVFGRLMYQGRPVHGFGATSTGVPLDSYGRLVYLDVFNSALGAGWKRENSFLARQPTGHYCYGFFQRDRYAWYPSGPPSPPANGERYRLTAGGPGVTPFVAKVIPGLPDYSANDPELVAIDDADPPGPDHDRPRLLQPGLGSGTAEEPDHEARRPGVSVDGCRPGRERLVESLATEEQLDEGSLGAAEAGVDGRLVSHLEHPRPRDNRGLDPVDVEPDGGGAVEPEQLRVAPVSNVGDRVGEHLRGQGRDPEQRQTELVQRVDDPADCLPRLGRPVVAGPLRADALDQAGSSELAQAATEQARGEARVALLELAEAHRPVPEQVAEQEQRPAVAKQVEGDGDRAELLVAALRLLKHPAANFTVGGSAYERGIMLSTSLRRLAALGGAALVTSAVVAAIALAGGSATSSVTAPGQINDHGSSHGMPIWVTDLTDAKTVIGRLSLPGFEPIDVLAYSVGVSNNDGVVDAADYVVWRKIDSASPGLWAAAESGRRFATATFTVELRSGGRSARAVYELEDVAIRELVHSSDGGAPLEQISFIYEEISFKYTE